MADNFWSILPNLNVTDNFVTFSRYVCWFLMKPWVISVRKQCSTPLPPSSSTLTVVPSVITQAASFPQLEGFVFICDSSLAESPLAGFFHIVVADVQVEKVIQNGKSKSQFGKKEKSKDKSSAHGSSFGKEEKSKDKSPKESAHGSSKEGAHGSSKEGAHGSSKEGAHARMMKEVIRDKLRKLGDRKPASAHGSGTEDAHAFDARMKELIREKMRKFGDRKPACKRKSAPS